MKRRDDMNGDSVRRQTSSGVAREARDLLDRARSVESTDPSIARTCALSARLLARDAGDRALESEALYRLASIAHYDGHPGDALALAEETLVFAEEHSISLVQAWSLHLMAVIHSDAGNHTDALAWSLRALALYRSTDHRVDEGNILNTVATIHHELGDIDRAIVNYEAARKANSRDGRADLDAIALSNIAALRSERGDLDTGIELGTKAVEVGRIHARGFLSRILTSLAESLARRADVERGDLDRARDLLAEALRLLDESSVRFDDAARTEVELAMGRLEVRADRPESAEEHLREALGLAQVIGARRLELAAISELATLTKKAGRLAEAVAYLEARCDVAERLAKDGLDTRVRTLQIAHEAETARHRTEIVRLRLAVAQRSSELE